MHRKYSNKKRSRKRSLKRSHSHRKMQKGGNEEEWWNTLTGDQKVNELTKLVKGFANAPDKSKSRNYFEKIVLAWWRSLSEQNKLEYKTLMSVQTGSIKL